VLQPSDFLLQRHIGPSDKEIDEMLKVVGYKTLKEFMHAVVPESIRNNRELNVGPARTEAELLDELLAVARQNKVLKTYIGTGYYDVHVPKVILRNLMENPQWYTSYTPYQAEISQGRMESLLNYQTMIVELTKMEIANASLLDAATAAAEAMNMCTNTTNRNKFFVSQNVHPQTIAVIKTRAEYMNIEVIVGDHRSFDFAQGQVSGALVQYPATDGAIEDYEELGRKIHAAGSQFVVATDLLALTKFKAPGEFGADITLGSAQRFGVPMGYGGPHAAFFGCTGAVARKMPGRVMGVSRDADGNPGIRLALQTREQHIRREKATSNVCTAQALLANMAAMYAIYHGPEGLKHIANRVNACAIVARTGLTKLGYKVDAGTVFDTIRIRTPEKDKLLAAGVAAGMNFRPMEDGVCLSFDETTKEQDMDAIFKVFAKGKPGITAAELVATADLTVPANIIRMSPFLQNPTFNSHHSETAMLRYLTKLQNRDVSLANSMIPLGSCTMKLNATSEMIPVTWPEFGSMHPFAPLDQCKGYATMIRHSESLLCDITGFKGVTLQPNSGAQGEYAGLLTIRKYHDSIGESFRDVCLIPNSAHGTNPASAAMVGLKVVVTKTDQAGDIDINDLKEKVEKHKDRLSCVMITYPSTHGVFETGVKEIIDLVHSNGGQVYMDGANMNAQVGWTSPGEIGADVCHLNLHKTFCIPHGGGGPGLGPIGVAKQLVPFLPNHPHVQCGGHGVNGVTLGPISAAPYSSTSILPISYFYILAMGSAGLKKATAVACLNANYMAARLKDHYPLLFTAENGRNAHEFILNINPIKNDCGITEKDIAKRLMDYGFHAPTMSWPAVGTLMVEPTESENKEELDRFIDALISIRKEIKDVENGTYPADNNPLVNSPHSLQATLSTEWNRPYTRETAAFPLPYVKHSKFWPIGRIDDVFGDRNLVCSCPPLESYDEMTVAQEVPKAKTKVKA